MIANMERKIKMRKNIVVAATGASGIPILVECLKIIKENPEYKSYLIISDSAKITLEQETKYSLEDIYEYAGEVLDLNNIGAGPASGTFKTEGMLIVPCSMKTIAGINSGYTDNANGNIFVLFHG